MFLNLLSMRLLSTFFLGLVSLFCSFEYRRIISDLLQTLLMIFEFLLMLSLCGAAVVLLLRGRSDEIVIDLLFLFLPLPNCGVVRNH